MLQDPNVLEVKVEPSDEAKKLGTKFDDLGYYRSHSMNQGRKLGSDFKSTTRKVRPGYRFPEQHHFTEISNPTFGMSRSAKPSDKTVTVWAISAPGAKGFKEGKISPSNPSTNVGYYKFSLIQPDFAVCVTKDGHSSALPDGSSECGEHESEGASVQAEE